MRKSARSGRASAGPDSSYWRPAPESHRSAASTQLPCSGTIPSCASQRPAFPASRCHSSSRSAACRRSQASASAVAHARAVLDKHGNIMVLMTHNTDLGDSFEREADDPQYFYQMSVPGYAFGINTLLYALTH